MRNCLKKMFYSIVYFHLKEVIYLGINYNVLKNKDVLIITLINIISTKCHTRVLNEISFSGIKCMRF